MRPRKPTYMQHGHKVGTVDCYILRDTGKELLCSGEIYQIPHRTEYHWPTRRHMVLDRGGVMEYVERWNDGMDQRR